jgi:Cu(I)/Ag(I) efflux system membrane protein CusA/SilA
METLAGVLVAAPSGAQVPLAQVARFEHTRGAAMITSENGLLLATVLLNIQGRDVTGFVEDAKAAVAAQVALPAGYFLGWSGQYENQELARRRLQLILPIVLVVIFALLYFTYHSALEAFHVLLTVPFALTGGVFLLWATGYNFSVAVWVGFIALFGTAVQTAVVMVIYLDEAVRRKMAQLGTTLTKTELREAVMEGALLRLRPKVMTVSTVVAGLLPIMWTDRVGAEVMKPLATPVLGGMVSSLLYVLIVTPVLFYWIHERRLRVAANVGRVPLGEGAGGPGTPSYVGRAPRGEDTGGSGMPSYVGRILHSAGSGGPGVRVFAASLAIVALAGAGWWIWSGQGQTANGTTSAVLQTIRSGDLVVTLSNPEGRLRAGTNRFRVEFRSAATNAPVDVGTVELGASMTMPGMVMNSPITTEPTGQPGIYEGTGNFGMSGSWRMTIEWNGPAGRGSAAFEGNVQ